MRAVKDTRRYWLPPRRGGAVPASRLLGLPPLVAYVLIMPAFGFCFDAATAWLARAGGTGGMHDYKQ